MCSRIGKGARMGVLLGTLVVMHAHASVCAYAGVHAHICVQVCMFISVCLCKGMHAPCAKAAHPLSDACERDGWVKVDARAT